MFAMYDEAVLRLVNAVKQEMVKFDENSGRLLESNGGWAVTNQDVMLSMAFLYLNAHPSNPFYQDAAFLERIGRIGDAYRAFQYEDGKVEFVKIDGSKWGPIYMPWSMYHWLETYIRLAPFFDPARQEYWREGLVLGFEGMYSEQAALLAEQLQHPESASASAIHNIPTWNAMALHRAAAAFGRPEWKEDADAMIRLVISHQHPDGYWSEHDGPTTLYNLIYVHAIGLYRLHGGVVDVMPALRKAFAFTRLFMYPDSTLVETIDGRCKYDPAPFMVGLPGIAQVEGGKQWIEKLVEQADPVKTMWSRPHFAELLHYWHTFEESTSADTIDSVRMQLAKAWVVKQDGWFVCLSGFTSPAVESRWGMDRQSFIGIWHESNGLIIGGGNSKNQPEWSTFDVVAADGNRQYVPDNGGADETASAVRLRYGTRALTISLITLTRERIELELCAELGEGDSGIFRLPLKINANAPIESSFMDCSDRKACEIELNAEVVQNVQWIGQQGWRLSAEGPFRVDWPSYPFNPYAQDGKADMNSAIAILSIPLVSNESKRISVSVMGNVE